MFKKHIPAACAILLASTAAMAQAQDQVLNIYSARHYPTDEALYTNFTKATGIRINRVDADDAGILARLKAERTASPADVILLVDAARLWKGEVEGLFQPVKSKALDDAVPIQLRGKATSDGASPWFGFSTRARVIVYDKVKVQKGDVDTYEELGDPKNRGILCIRSGSHPYNLSLFGAVLEHLGEQKTEAWLKGMVGYFGSRAERRRHRPDQSRCRWRMQHCGHQHLLPCPHHALGQGRGQSHHGPGGCRLPESGILGHARQYRWRGRGQECKEPGQRHQISGVSCQRTCAGPFCQRQ